MVSEKAIEVKNLVKKYKKAKENAVDDVSFEVAKGEFFAFLGPNGAGKTTTISILTTTLAKTSGEVKIAGFDVNRDAGKIRQRVGIIFQKPSLDLNLTAEENIRLHAVLYNLYSFRPSFKWMSEDYRKQVNELADILGIASSLNKPVKTFSGGMKRKLEIVRSLMHNPEILFLDEPTTGLDPESRRNLWTYLQKVRKERGTTIFLTTHYLDEVEGADRVVIINKGKIVEDGSPESIKSKLVEEKLELIPHTAAELAAELDSLKLEYIKQGRSFILNVTGKSVQEIIKKINTKLDTVDIHRPSLEEAYLKIIAVPEEEENANSN